LALGKKIIIVKNATAYTWDWYCHLVVDRASFVKLFTPKAPAKHEHLLNKPAYDNCDA
jgi:hypothetical protein